MDGVVGALGTPSQYSECALIVLLIYLTYGVESVVALTVRTIAWLFKKPTGARLPGDRPGPRSLFLFVLGAVTAYVLCHAGIVLLIRVVS